jgi:hypothetical protein
VASRSADKGYVLSSNYKGGADFRIRTQGKRVSEVAQKLMETSQVNESMNFLPQPGAPHFALQKAIANGGLIQKT